MNKVGFYLILENGVRFGSFMFTVFVELKLLSLADFTGNGIKLLLIKISRRLTSCFRKFSHLKQFPRNGPTRFFMGNTKYLPHNSRTILEFSPHFLPHPHSRTCIGVSTTWILGQSNVSKLVPALQIDGLRGLGRPPTAGSEARRF